jgi:uncharacterized membrane protein YgcG
LSGRILCDKLIPLPEEIYQLWCVIVCALETTRMRRPWPALGCCAVGSKEGGGEGRGRGRGEGRGKGRGEGYRGRGRGDGGGGGVKHVIFERIDIKLTLVQWNPEYIPIIELCITH